MSMPSITHARFSPHSHHAARTWPFASAAHIVAEVGRTYRAWRAVRELKALDDRMLREIGVSRGEIEQAVWRGRDLV